MIRSGDDVAQQIGHDQKEDAGDKRDDGLQVTDAESHDALPIASELGAPGGATDADCKPIVAKTIETKSRKRITAVLIVWRRVSTALPGAVLRGQVAEASE